MLQLDMEDASVYSTLIRVTISSTPIILPHVGEGHSELAFWNALVAGILGDIFTLLPPLPILLMGIFTS